jgi:hypothetical protein
MSSKFNVCITMEVPIEVYSVLYTDWMQSRLLESQKDVEVTAEQRNVLNKRALELEAELAKVRESHQYLDKLIFELLFDDLTLTYINSEHLMTYAAKQLTQAKAEIERLKEYIERKEGTGQ